MEKEEIIKHGEAIARHVHELCPADMKLPHALVTAAKAAIGLSEIDIADMHEAQRVDYLAILATARDCLQDSEERGLS